MMTNEQTATTPRQIHFDAADRAFKARDTGQFLAEAWAWYQTLHDTMADAEAALAIDMATEGSRYEALAVAMYG
jgi:hypothetical protein